jgi:lysozyme family protein
MTDLVALKAANAKRWPNAKLTRNFASVAARLAAAKSRYQAVEKETGVPWYFIAVAHEREASQNWNTQLGQGDPLDRVSVHVPAGRGPFQTWEEGAVDALVHCQPFPARNKDWSAGSLLTMLEQYNGLGYANHGVPSPYVWSGTDQYHSGKYVRDGVYDASVVDQQLGCAGLLIAMMALDHSIEIGSPALVVASTLSPAVSTTPSITNPASGSIGAWLASFFTKGKKAS